MQAGSIQRDAGMRETERIRRAGEALSVRPNGGSAEKVVDRSVREKPVALTRTGMKRRCGTGSWVAGAFCGALALTIIVLAIKGTSAKGTVVALQVTARWSFILFWPAYAGSSMTALFGPAFKILAQRGREFGLAYASAHLIHVGLVAWLYRISPEPPVSEGAFLFFTVGIVWTYLLAACSIGRLSNALNRALWRLLRIIGLNYIAFAFLTDFVIGPLRAGIEYQGLRRILEYLPFAIFAVAGPLLRLAVLAQRVGLRSARA